MPDEYDDGYDSRESFERAGADGPDDGEPRAKPVYIMVTLFPDLMPPTLISRDRAMIQDFRKEHGDVVMKPLYGHGGAAVFKVAPRDPNFAPLATADERMKVPGFANVEDSSCITASTLVRTRTPAQIARTSDPGVIVLVWKACPVPLGMKR